MRQPKIRKRKTFDLRLSKFELIHLRDLMSIRLPIDLKQTVSQALAASEERGMVEAHLWNQVVEACKVAEVPLGDDAPDFICAASAPPPVGVFRLAESPNESEEQAAQQKSVFDHEEE